MADTQNGAVPGKNANHSRPDGVRSCESRGERQQTWTGPLRRTRRAIVAALRLIHSSRRTIDACDGLAAERPLRATRRLERVAGQLVKATVQLQRGVDCLNETNYRLAAAPGEGGDAPGRIIEATARWIDAASQLAALSNRLDDTSAGLLADIEEGASPLDLEELFGNDGPAPRLITSNGHSVTLLARERSRIFCIHIRRRRSARLPVVEAPKRVSRGRAPPLFSTCAL